MFGKPASDVMLINSCQFRILFHLQDAQKNNIGLPYKSPSKSFISIIVFLPYFCNSQYKPTSQSRGRECPLHMRPNCTCLISFDIAQIQFRSSTLEQGRLAFGRMHRKSMQRELPFPSRVYEKLGGAAQVLRRCVAHSGAPSCIGL